MCRIVLVGHSFSGAVVITAAAISAAMIAVDALSSQAAGTEAVSRPSPKLTVSIHGEANEVPPPACWVDRHQRAGHPKELVLYPGWLHGPGQCRDALDRDLTRWLRQVLEPQ